MDSAERLITLLRAKGLTVATAESCTGGLVAAEIVSISGASEVFFEGLVTYSNESKMNRLKVSGESLAHYGAVSSVVSEEMSMGLLRYSDVGISTTGIAGPGGGTEEKPVGLVYISVASKKGVRTKKLLLTDMDRNSVRKRATEEAICLACEYVSNLL